MIVRMEDLCRATQWSAETVRKKIATGIIKAERVPESYRYMMTQAEYDKWFNGVTEKKRGLTYEQLRRIARTA